MNPHPKNLSKELLAVADRVLAPCYKQPPTLFVKGEGSRLFDAEGKSYLDMTSGIAVSALGHNSQVFRQAVLQASKGLVHTSNLFFTEPAIHLAALLVEKSFADRVFFSNSGAEANEAAIKFARLHGGETRREIVYFSGSFHGRTLGSLAATAKPAIQTPFHPLPDGFTQAPWNEEAGLITISDKTAAVIVEPIQGESGVRVPDKSWLQALRRRCDKVGALLIFDEVQVGMGRTGKLWAHEAFDVTPDLMTLAKPLGGGLPIGATLLSESAAKTIYPGCHGTTFGGGPFVASVAAQIFKTVSAEGFLDDVRRKGDLLGSKLTALDSPLIKNVRGMGLIRAIELNIKAAPVVDAALQQGLLLVAAGEHVIRFLPALNVEDSELLECIAILKNTLSQVQEET